MGAHRIDEVTVDEVSVSLEKRLRTHETCLALRRLYLLNDKHRGEPCVRDVFHQTGFDGQQEAISTFLGYVVPEERLQGGDLGSAITLAVLPRHDILPNCLRGLRAEGALGLLAPSAWSILLNYVVRRWPASDVSKVVPRRNGRCGVSAGFVINSARRIGEAAVRPTCRGSLAIPVALAWRTAHARRFS